MHINEAYSYIVFQLAEKKILPNGKHDDFYKRFLSAATDLTNLYNAIYFHHPQQEFAFHKLVNAIIDAYASRSKALKERDAAKPRNGFSVMNWQV